MNGPRTIDDVFTPDALCCCAFVHCSLQKLDQHWHSFLTGTKALLFSIKLQFIPGERGRRAPQARNLRLLLALGGILAHNFPTTTSVCVF